MPEKDIRIEKEKTDHWFLLNRTPVELIDLVDVGTIALTIGACQPSWWRAEGYAETERKERMIQLWKNTTEKKKHVYSWNRSRKYTCKYKTVSFSKESVFVNKNKKKLEIKTSWRRETSILDVITPPHIFGE
jgi:hypothetical protein